MPLRWARASSLSAEALAAYVCTRTVTGSIGVLANHAPLMAILEPTELRLYKSDSDIVRFAQPEALAAAHTTAP